MKISGCGVLLVGGEVFRWRPWLQEQRKEGTVIGGGLGDDVMTGQLLNAKKQWEVPDSVWGVLDLVYPKPGLCIVPFLKMEDWG
jgi:NADH dehydrogenase [ubiquinone] 1 alpha subcomplex assembly factor 3